MRQDIHRERCDSIEPGGSFRGHLVTSSMLAGPGTHPRSPFTGEGFARLIDFDPNVYGYAVPREALWTALNSLDLAAADAAALPRPLQQLWALALGARWLARITWQATRESGRPGSIGYPFATLEVGRKAADESRTCGWLYQYTWHTYPHGSYRLFGKLSRTPDRPAWHEGPSLQQVRHVIAAYPVTLTASDASSGRPAEGGSRPLSA